METSRNEPTAARPAGWELRHKHGGALAQQNTLKNQHSELADHMHFESPETSWLTQPRERLPPTKSVQEWDFFHKTRLKGNAESKLRGKGMERKHPINFIAVGSSQLYST